MSIFTRAFECEDRQIEVRTNDFINFGVWTVAYYGDYNPKTEKLIGEFHSNHLNNACVGFNSEKPMSDFLAKRYKLNNVYSVNDFKEIK